PQVATFEIQDKVYVYKVVDGCAKSTLVTVARIDDSRSYMVLSGLQMGEIIVADGAGLVREGTRVAAQDEPAQADKSVENE
ncbi:MAG: efflux RND transporter periplasmic adaptor subunit, partial [Bacteroidales bacterium]|nr:efflux RND transporter periplasmic adaptor subunit [Bacteroidales bacterium]